MKPEAPFHEMIPRKSTIKNNLTSSLNPSKMRVKKFIFSKFAGSQACIQQTVLSNKLLHMYFWQHFKSAPCSLPPRIDLSPPHQILKRPRPHVLNTCGKPSSISPPPFMLGDATISLKFWKGGISGNLKSTCHIYLHKEFTMLLVKKKLCTIKYGLEDSISDVAMTCFSQATN